MAAASSSEPLSRAEKARSLREIADSVERGEELTPEVAELAERLAKQAKHARFAAAFKKTVDDHPAIFAALAK